MHSISPQFCMAALLPMQTALLAFIFFNCVTSRSPKRHMRGETVNVNLVNTKLKVDKVHFALQRSALLLALNLYACSKTVFHLCLFKACSIHLSLCNFFPQHKVKFNFSEANYIFRLSSPAGMLQLVPTALENLCSSKLPMLLQRNRRKSSTSVDTNRGTHKTLRKQTV